ncbi:MAG TPA: ABC transporter ATP-binding protein [Desulfobacterales bacterium]|nr:ABC transporter ATP-binding protein [Desulfobacterales bacterium]
MKIEIKGVSKDLPMVVGGYVPVFANLNLMVEPGSFVVVLGASGCGKSTLLDMLAGLTKPCRGTILIDGHELTAPHPSRSLLFQHPSLLPWLTVTENVAFGCQVRGEVNNLEQRVEEIIAMIGLRDFAGAYPAELSLGMAQRVCLARALLGQPRVLLMDEPFSSLDSFNRRNLQREVVNIWQRRHLTIVMVTHDLEEAVLLGQRIIFLGGHPGKVRQTYDIDLPYPRDMGSEDFFKLRNEIIEELRHNYADYF